VVPPCDACRPQTVYSPFVTSHFLLATSLKAISNQRTADSSSETRGRQFTVSSLDTQTHNMFHINIAGLCRVLVWYGRVLLSCYQLETMRSVYSNEIVVLSTQTFSK
jgi:hypothetical protein